MIKIFCNKFVYQCVSQYVNNINKYFLDLHINSQIVLYTKDTYIGEYVITNNIKNSFIIYIQRQIYVSPKEYHNKEFIFNIEQMINFDFKPWFNTHCIANSGINIVDYNITNINIIRNINPTSDIYHIPYLYHDEGIHNEPLYDVCLIGSFSEHRNNIYQNLLKNGISTIFVYNKFGDICDNIISESKIVLNIHYTSETNILETIRCYQGLYKKKIVVSEDSIYDVNNDLDNLIVYSPYEKLVDTVKNVLADFGTYKKRIDNFDFDKIKHKHRTLMDNFLQQYKYFDLCGSVQKNY